MRIRHLVQVSGAVLGLMASACGTPNASTAKPTSSVSGTLAPGEISLPAATPAPTIGQFAFRSTEAPGVYMEVFDQTTALVVGTHGYASIPSVPGAALIDCVLQGTLNAVVFIDAPSDFAAVAYAGGTCSGAGATPKY